MTIAESTPAVPASRRRGYWRAEGLITESMSRFEQATASSDPKLQRSVYYRLAKYYARTIHILNSALSGPNEALAHAALHNQMALHRAMIQMHHAAPDVVPLSGPYHVDDRHEFVRDIIIRVLSESPGLLEPRAIRDRVNHMDMLGRITLKRVRDDLSDLEATGHLLADLGLERSLRAQGREHARLELGDPLLGHRHDGDHRAADLRPAKGRDVNEWVIMKNRLILRIEAGGGDGVNAA